MLCPCAGSAADTPADAPADTPAEPSTVQSTTTMVETIRYFLVILEPRLRREWTPSGFHPVPGIAIVPAPRSTLGAVPARTVRAGRTPDGASGAGRATVGGG
ncbi:hypothetical protein GCM10009760_10830 [Kitasatospora kazusensis]|uniref:Uncharacterized protein n=1 Tax=Kitasatospora kazusensis TaxID=407974 RepID=A0ABN2YYG1_9ACTN